MNRQALVLLITFLLAVMPSVVFAGPMSTIEVQGSFNGNPIDTLPLTQALTGSGTNAATGGITATVSGGNLNISVAASVSPPNSYLLLVVDGTPAPGTYVIEATLTAIPTTGVPFTLTTVGDGSSSSIINGFGITNSIPIVGQTWVDGASGMVANTGPFSIPSSPSQANFLGTSTELFSEMTQITFTIPSSGSSYVSAGVLGSLQDPPVIPEPASFVVFSIVPLCAVVFGWRRTRKTVLA